MIPSRGARGASFGFEFQGRCSAFTSWRARERGPKTFSLAAHNISDRGRAPPDGDQSGAARRAALNSQFLAFAAIT
jgi:hypothetical protein